MKRFATLLIALSVLVAGVAFGQDAPEAPEVSWGVDGTYAYNVLSSNSETEADENGQNSVESRPYGLGANELIISPWVQMDWARLMVRLDSRYDHFDMGDENDYSFVKVSSAYSNLFGAFTLYNDFLYRVAEEDDAAVPPVDDKHMEFDSHKIGLGGSVGDFSGRINWSYDAARPFLNSDSSADGVDTVAAGGENDALDNAISNVAGLNQFYSFDDLTLSMDNGLVGAMVKWEADDGAGDGGGAFAPGYYLTDAYLKGYGWFGLWDFVIGDTSNAKKLRMPALGKGIGFRGYTSQMGIGEFGASEFTYIDNDGDSLAAADQKIDVLNTFTISEMLKVHLGTIMPMSDEVAWGDYLSGEHVFLGAEYAMEGLTVNGGMGFVNDYVDASGTSTVVTESLVNGTMGRTSNLWVDAKLMPMEALTLQVGLDAQFAKYEDGTATGAKPAYEGFSLYNLGAEFEYAMAPLTLSGGLYAAFGAGIDLGKWVGDSTATFDTAFDDTAANVTNGDNFTESNFLMAAVYSDGKFDGDDGETVVSPLAAKIRADYVVSETLSVFAANTFTSLVGAFGSTLITSDTDVQDERVVALPAGADVTYRGYYGTNELSLGATIVPQENQSLGVSLGYTLYTGVPEENDLYTATGAATGTEYDQWKADRKSVV